MSVPGHNYGYVMLVGKSASALRPFFTVQAPACCLCALRSRGRLQGRQPGCLLLSLEGRLGRLGHACQSAGKKSVYVYLQEMLSLELLTSKCVN